MYGAGLRVSEVANLKAADLDRGRQMTWTRDAKGHKDRPVMLAGPLREVLVAGGGSARRWIRLTQSAQHRPTLQSDE